MISIVCALQWEATPIIKRLKLKKNLEILAYPVFSNSSTSLIVSGVGTIAAASATTLILASSPEPPDLICNIGTAGASYPWKVGDLALVKQGYSHSTGRSYFPDLSIRSTFPTATLESFDRPVSDSLSLRDKEALVDMEGAGFYLAAERFLGPDQIQLIKVVSDLLDPKPFKREALEILIEQKLGDILIYLDELLAHLKSSPRQVLSTAEQRLLAKLKEHYRLTEAQLVELRNLAIAFKIKSGPFQERLESLHLEQPENKQQAKSVFTKLKSSLLSQ